MGEQKVAQKKAYEAPKLLVYGTLAEMTKSGGKTGRLDMSMGSTRT